MTTERNTLRKAVQGKIRNGRSNYKGVPNMNDWMSRSSYTEGRGKLSYRCLNSSLRSSVVLDNPSVFNTNYNSLSFEKGKELVSRSDTSFMSLPNVYEFQERENTPDVVSEDSVPITKKVFGKIARARCSVLVQLPENIQGRVRYHSKRLQTQEVVAFEPSKDLSLSLLRSMSKRRGEYDKQFERYKENLSGEDLTYFQDLTDDLPSLSSSYINIEFASNQIKTEVARLLATIARAESTFGATDYTLTENGAFNDDVHGAFSDRLPLGVRNQEFMDELSKDLIHTAIRSNIGGKWGTLEYKQGELVMNIKLQSEIVKREWTRAKTI